MQVGTKRKIELWLGRVEATTARLAGILAGGGVSLVCFGLELGSWEVGTVVVWAPPPFFSNILCVDDLVFWLLESFCLLFSVFT